LAVPVLPGPAEPQDSRASVGTIYATINASVLQSAGISPAIVVERLGHDIKTLLRAYAHWL
jgi:hypothetical protein